MAKTNKKATGTTTKRGGKKGATGADRAPVIPALLTAVPEGAGELTVEEVIDRLFEVAAEDVPPGTYGFETREQAEAILDKSMGPDGKRARARARAKVEDRKARGETPPSERTRLRLEAEETARKAPEAAPTPVVPSVLEPAGPDLDFGDEGDNFGATAAEREAGRHERMGEHLAASLTPPEVDPRDVVDADAARALSKEETLAEVKAFVAGEDSVFTGTPTGGEGGFSEELAPPSGPAADPTPAAAQPDSNPAPSSRNAAGVTRAERLEQLKAMSRAELIAAYGKDTSAADAMVRCWVISKEFGTKKAKADDKPKAPVAPRDPRLAAVQKLRAAFETLNGHWSAFEFDKLGATIARELGESASAFEVFAVARARMSCCLDAFEAAVAGAPAAPPVTGTAVPAVTARPIEVGCTASIGPRFRDTYKDVLEPGQMVSLTVKKIQRDVAVCATGDGDVEEVRIPVKHLIRAS